MDDPDYCPDKVKLSVDIWSDRGIGAGMMIMGTRNFKACLSWTVKETKKYILDALIESEDDDNEDLNEIRDRKVIVESFAYVVGFTDYPFSRKDMNEPLSKYYPQYGVFKLEMRLLISQKTRENRAPRQGRKAEQPKFDLDPNFSKKMRSMGCHFCGDAKSKMQKEKTGKKRVFCDKDCQTSFYSGSFSVNIEDATLHNSDYRRVLNTTKDQQLVVMCITPEDHEIGEEVHPHTTQFIRIEKGMATAIVDGITTILKEGAVIMVNRGAKHNIINLSQKEPLRLYTLYSPPHHAAGLVEKRKGISIQGKFIGGLFSNPVASIDVNIVYQYDDIDFLAYNSAETISQLDGKDRQNRRWATLALELTQNPQTNHIELRRYRQDIGPFTYVEVLNHVLRNIDAPTFARHNLDVAYMGISTTPHGRTAQYGTLLSERKVFVHENDPLIVEQDSDTVYVKVIFKQKGQE